jgi:hypothetical protein
MEGGTSPAPEVIAYRAESTSEGGKPGGAAHLVLLRVARLKRAFTQLAGIGSFQGLKTRQFPSNRSVQPGKGVPLGVSKTAGQPLPKRLVPLLPLICSLERFRFEQLKRDLLSQHRIADRQVTSRHEAQHANAVAACVELLDVHQITQVNAVTSTGLAANDVEIVEQLELASLSGR